MLLRGRAGARKAGKTGFSRRFRFPCRIAHSRHTHRCGQGRSPRRQPHAVPADGPEPAAVRGDLQRGRHRPGQFRDDHPRFQGVADQRDPERHHPQRFRVPGSVLGQHPRPDVPFVQRPGPTRPGYVGQRRGRLRGQRQYEHGLRHPGSGLPLGSVRRLVRDVPDHSVGDVRAAAVRPVFQPGVLGGEDGRLHPERRGGLRLALRRGRLAQRTQLAAVHLSDGRPAERHHLGRHLPGDVRSGPYL